MNRAALFFVFLVSLFLSVKLNAQQTVNNGQINLTLPSGTKIFYVNIMDSVSNTVSTNFVTLGSPLVEDSLSANRIEFDSTVWSVPQIYDAPISLNYPNEKAFYYAGLDYMRHKTKVFAYIGFPANASATNKVPAVVLVHGGGGTALPQWVKIWNNRGYAAIAMDLDGCQPVVPEGYQTNFIIDSGDHITGGPSNTNFGDINSPIKNQWMYHAVADVYLAYSILAADERVDSTKIGITGISWGGIITSIAIGNSDCFAFAIPVYGCGYLNTSKALFKSIYNEVVSNQWEASKWLHLVNTLTLWINSDSDNFFSIDATAKSALATKNSIVTIKPGYPHSHEYGWSPLEIYNFANSVVKGGKKLIQITKQPSEDDLTILFDSDKSSGVRSAKMFYSNDTLSYDSNNKLTNQWLQYILQISTSVKQSDDLQPESFLLSQNYPNPFNPNTEIKYSIPENGMVTLKVYNLLGQELVTLVNMEQKSGNYTVNFNASNLASGVYMYRIQAGSFALTKKMLLLK